MDVKKKASVMVNLNFLRAALPKNKDLASQLILKASTGHVLKYFVTHKENFATKQMFISTTSLANSIRQNVTEYYYQKIIMPILLSHDKLNETLSENEDPINDLLTSPLEDYINREISKHNASLYPTKEILEWVCYKIADERLANAEFPPSNLYEQILVVVL
jgi:hypothetical protein